MLKNKVAVITGGTRGIGLEITKVFLENGAKVVIFGSKKQSVENALHELKNINLNYDVIGFFPDLSNEGELEKVFSNIYQKYKSIDILINNAGISSSTPIEKYEDSEINELININIKAPFLCSKVAVKYLKQSKGTIVNTSSMVGIYGQASGCLYPISKFAINGLTKSLSRELAPFGIRVNAVAPGITETDMVKNLPDEMINPLKKSIPIGRIGTVTDIANAFLFLVSEKASYITGEILQVDGGMRS